MSWTRRGVALGAAGLAAGCSAMQGFGDGLMRDLGRASRERVRLAPVQVSEERIIRIDVGLRPFRPSGFRVEREAFGEQSIVHNYGHGGGGITLSWGTAHLALERGFDPGVREYAVLGCGAVGLATARLLQERGAQVRIYARDLPPNTTSNVAGAQWWPSSVYSRRSATPAYLEKHFAAAHFAFGRYQSLVGGGYGVEWEVNYHLSDDPITDYPAGDNELMRALVVNQQDLSPEEHPFAARYVRRFDTMMIETPLYLRRMEADVREAGGEIVVRTFSDAAQVHALTERVVFNCTGLGAGALFGDGEIVPVRGQLAILLPQAEVNYNVLTDGGLYMFGRRDGIVLGGTFERGQWSREPVPETIARLVNGHRALFEAMRG